MLTIFLVYCKQGFIQAILMSVRLHKNLDFLMEFSNSVFVKFYFKQFGVEITFKIHWLTRFHLDFFYLSFRCRKATIFQGLHTVNPPPNYESIAELTAFWDPHLHLTTFENSILVQKKETIKTAWINNCILLKSTIFDLQSETNLEKSHIYFFCIPIKKSIIDE